MIYKRIIAACLLLVFAVMMTACSNDTSDIGAETTTATSEIVADVTDTQKETTVASQTAETTLLPSDETTTVSADDPAMWSVAQTVEVYKNAAIKTNSSATSVRNISLKGISINNGQFEGALNLVTPIMAKIIAKNSEEVPGITGGFTKLSEADVGTAKAYKSGENTVIEMTMRKQTDGARGDMNGGSVGHAMSVVGDISIVVQQLKDFGLPLELSEKDTKIYYTNPVFKVVVGADGKIVKGTWSYTVEISMNNYKAFGQTVANTSVIMDNVITLGGGF